MSSAPIGIFDSGVGGLTVARAILDQLPNESTIYIGDTARGPYGPRPLAEVRDFSLETIDFLIGQGAKAVVIACNTASAAMQTLTSMYPNWDNFEIFEIEWKT